MTSLIISLDQRGNYEVRASSSDRNLEDELCRGENSVFVADSGMRLFHDVKICGWLVGLSQAEAVDIGITSLVFVVSSAIVIAIGCRRARRGEHPEGRDSMYGGVSEEAESFVEINS
jgi:hypothetical protein